MWREEIDNAEILPRQYYLVAIERASGAFSVLQPRTGSREWRRGCNFSLSLPPRFAERSILLSSKQKKEHSREKHANGTAESGVFLLPFLRSREKKCSSRNYRFFHLSRAHSVKIAEIAVVYRNWLSTLKFYLLRWPSNRWPSKIFIFFHLVHSESPRSTQEQRRDRCDAKMIPQIHPSSSRFN